MLGHGPSSKALRAALTASSTSALSPSAIRASTSSFAGLIVSKVLPDFAGTHLPSISSCLGLRKNDSAAEILAPCAALSTWGVAAIGLSACIVRTPDPAEHIDRRYVKGASTSHPHRP